MHIRALVVAGALSVLACGAALGQTPEPGRQPVRGEQPERAEQPERGAPPRDPAQFVARMMENDANSDGKLSKEEMPGRFAERMFETADGNGDGMLDSEELTKFASEFRPGAGGREGAGARRVAGGRGGAAAFEDAMNAAGRALRGLRRSAMDPSSREEDLVLVQDLQAALIAAKGASRDVPMAPQAKDRYGEDSAAYARDMRLGFIATLSYTLELEGALLEGDSAAAKEALAGVLTSQKQGHDAFQPEEEEEEEGAEGGDPRPAGRE